MAMRRFAAAASLIMLAFLNRAAAQQGVRAPKLEAFDYGNVKLLPGPVKNRFEVNREYLMSISNDSLLYPFYKEAVIRVPPATRPLGGWEAMSVDIRGHFLGHYLSACARIFATTGDDELKVKCDSIVSEMARIQKTNGNGYVGPISEKVFTALENGRERDVWAPYYVIHKVLMGLYEMYRYAGNDQALEVAKGMADWVKGRTDKLSAEVMARTLEVEHGGMTEALNDLYAATGERKYLDLAKRFEHARFLDPLAQNQDNLTNVHANTNIPKIYGAIRAYELTGDPRYMDIAANFWNVVVKTRTYATGGSNNHEYWGKPNELSKTLSESNQETCTAYNMMWLTRYLLRWTADAKYGDFYERNFFNGILTAQNPADGQFCYFTPMKSGSSKRFGTPLNSFWCCYGTGVQAFAELTSSIYFHDASSLYVNLFVPSEVGWRHPGGLVRVVQETKYPEVTSTQLTMRTASPAQFALKVRVPWWVRKGVEVRVNGQKVDLAAKPSAFLSLERTWKDQDVVEVSMPMSLYAEPIDDDPDLIAVMYGPLVMAGLVFEEMTFKGDKQNIESWIEPAKEEDRLLASHLRVVHDQLPTSLYPEHFSSHDSNPYNETTIKRPQIALTFQTKSPNPRVKFVPLYEILDWPYGIYFRVKN